MNDDVRLGLEFLRRKENRNKAFAVRQIEEALKLPSNTLASPFNKLVKAGQEGIERADVTLAGTTRTYRGFKYVGD